MQKEKRYEISTDLTHEQPHQLPQEWMIFQNETLSDSKANEELLLQFKPHKNNHFSAALFTIPIISSRQTDKYTEKLFKTSLIYCSAN